MNFWEGKLLESINEGKNGEENWKKPSVSIKWLLPGERSPVVMVTGSPSHLVSPPVWYLILCFPLLPPHSFESLKIVARTFKLFFIIRQVFPFFFPLFIVNATTIILQDKKAKLEARKSLKKGREEHKNRKSQKSNFQKKKNEFKRKREVEWILRKKTEIDPHV